VGHNYKKLLEYGYLNMTLINKNKGVTCPKNEGICSHFNPKSRNKRTCFIMMAYEEECSPIILRILKNATKVLNLKPVLAKEVKGAGSKDMFCTKICQKILESTYSIADFTYKNNNVGFECGLAQGLWEKPVIITQYISPKQKKPIKVDDKKVLKKLSEAGMIQYSPLPLDIPSDLSSVYYFKYSSEVELKNEFKKVIKVKK